MAEEGIDPPKAQNLARRGKSASYGEVRFVMNLSHVYYITGRYDLALGEARKARNGAFGNGKAHFIVGLAAVMHDSDDHRREAKESFEKALTLNLSPEDIATAKQYLEQL